MNQHVAPSRASIAITSALAIFAMFFGAGNVVLPLSIGFTVGLQAWLAIGGFLVTAVAVPVVGLVSMVLFNGDYRAFFFRLGRVPGFLLILLCIILMGPFGAMPRCVTLSHTTLSTFVPGISLSVFSALAAGLIFIFAMRENRLIDVLGRILSPIKIALFLLIIVKGIATYPAQSVAIGTGGSKVSLVVLGLSQGYLTMDLIGALFFAAIVLHLLSRSALSEEKIGKKQLVRLMLQASAVAGLLLAAMYAGLTMVAALWSGVVPVVTMDQTISVLACAVLGNVGGLVASCAVIVACLTTAIALAAVFSEFLQHDVCNGKISYIAALCITVVLTVVFSLQGFGWIMSVIWPVLEVCYPALIMLAVMNMLYKLYDVRMVKTPVALALLGSFLLAHGASCARMLGLL